MSDPAGGGTTAPKNDPAGNPGVQHDLTASASVGQEVHGGANATTTSAAPASFAPAALAPTHALVPPHVAPIATAAADLPGLLLGVDPGQANITTRHYCFLGVDPGQANFAATGEVRKR